MKTLKYTLLAALLLPLLHSCSNEEEALRTEPTVLEDGEGLIRLQFDMPKSKGKTYAGIEFKANDNEKEIRSIAIFTKNRDEGTGADLKRGAFNKFFSTEDLRSSTGLYEPLEENNYTYTTTVKVRSDGFGDSKVDVFIIANYAENGLTQTLKDVLTYDQLKEVTTVPLTDNPTVPLLMVCEKEIDLTNGGTANPQFDMYRLVSRIDIENLAEAAGFTLTSAYLVNPRTYSFLGKGNPELDNIPVVTEFTPINANTGEAPKPTEVSCLYTYETNNSDPATATAVVVKGIYNNIQFEKKIQLKQPDKDGITGDPIALQPNYRYLVKIQPGQDPNSIDWNIKIAQWADGETIEVSPPSVMPEVLDFKINGSSTLPSTWDANSRVYRIDGNQPENITFTIRSKYTMNCIVSFKYHYKAAQLFGLEDQNSGAYSAFLQRSKPRVTYADVEQDYNITLPQLLSQPTGPVAVTISLESPNNRYNKTDITFLLMKDYDGTGINPVLVGGKYWAPVNVGATKNGNINNLENMGYVFQFGRNEYPSELIWGTTNQLPTGDKDDLMMGPIEYKDRSISKYITANGVIQTPSLCDWLAKDSPNLIERNNRWSPGINDSPCPNGWRLPTIDEWGILHDIFNNNNYIQNEYRRGYKGDEGEYLYLARCGNRGSAGHTWNTTSATNTTSTYLSSDIHLVNGEDRGTQIKSYKFIISTTQASNTSGFTQSWANQATAIRCIQQDRGDSRNGG